jgi:hypothetical protein
MDGHRAYSLAIKMYVSFEKGDVLGKLILRSGRWKPQADELNI